MFKQGDYVTSKSFRGCVFKILKIHNDDTVDADIIAMHLHFNEFRLHVSKLKLATKKQISGAIAKKIVKIKE